MNSGAVVLRFLAAVICLLSGCLQFRIAAHEQRAEVFLHLEMPGDRLVFQRDLKNKGRIPVQGRCSIAGAELDYRVREANSDKKSAWKKLGIASATGTFSYKVEAVGGWYSLEVRARSGGAEVANARVERVGVGEVFIVIGHSVAHGGEINLSGAADERVQTIALKEEMIREYEKTANSEILPGLVGSHFGSWVKPAPFGHGTYFWARFGELVVARENVPVLILNAAFGGTTLEQWAKSAQGEQFEHSFVRSEIGMPYVNLRNALKKYVSVLGVRAVLSDHGQNDWQQENTEIIYRHYWRVVERARSDLGFPRLAFVINRQTPYLTRTAVRAAQERLIKDVPFCFPGPDYDLLDDADRPDKTHLSESGMIKAAEMWSKALDAILLERVEPFLTN